MGPLIIKIWPDGMSPFSIGNTFSKGPFSIAMLVYWRVDDSEKRE